MTVSAGGVVELRILGGTVTFSRIEACKPPHVPVAKPGPCPGAKRGAKKAATAVKKAVAPAKKTAAQKAAPPVAPPAKPGPGTGRDLTTTSTDLNAMMRLPAKNERGADERLAAIAKVQGFDALPQLATASQLNTMIRDGGIEVWRGTRDFDDPVTGETIPGSELARQYRTGPIFYGQGNLSNGIYTARERRIADDPFHSGDSSGVNRIVIKPGARIISDSALWQMMDNDPAQADAEAAKRRHDEAYERLRGASLVTWADAKRAYDEATAAIQQEKGIFADTAAYAMAKGYDVIEDDRSDLGVGTYYNILNRAATAVERRPGDRALR